MASSMGPDRKVTDGLVLYLDATSTKSYPGSGTSWFDLISNESTCSFINGPTVTASFGGGNKIRLDATNDYMEIGNRETLNPTQYVTCASWFLYTSYSVYYAPIIFKKTTGNSFFEQYDFAIRSDGYLAMAIGNGSNSNTAINSPISYKNQLIYGTAIIDTPNRALRVYVDGTCVASGSHTFATMATSSVNLRIGGTNVSNFHGWFGGDIYTAEVYNRVLTDAEILQNYNAVAEKYGKNVVVTDLDALTFVNKAMLTSETQKKAINNLVVDLKSAGIWTKMKVIYPFVGGTAASHKWNLKDPRDLDAAFRMSFVGGWTHNSTGVIPNGTNAHGDTFFIPSSNQGAGSIHGSMYNITDLDSVYRNCFGGGTSALGFAFLAKSNTNIMSSRCYDGTVNTINSSNSDRKGYYVITRSSTTSFKHFRNNIEMGSNTNTEAGLASSNQKIFMSAYNLSGTAVNRNNSTVGFFSLGDGLTDTDAANLYTIVQKYQTTLGRQV